MLEDENKLLWKELYVNIEDHSHVQLLPLDLILNTNVHHILQWKLVIAIPYLMIASASMTF